MNTIARIAAAASIFLMCGCGDAETPKDAAAKDGNVVTPKVDTTPKVDVTPKVDTPETIKADIMAQMKAMTAIMQGVTDEASAKAAIPKIQAVREKMRSVAARARKVKVGPEEMNKPPTAEERAVQGAFINAMSEVHSKPALIEILAPALEGMDKDM